MDSPEGVWTMTSMGGGIAIWTKAHGCIHLLVSQDSKLNICTRGWLVPSVSIYIKENNNPTTIPLNLNLLKFLFSLESSSGNLDNQTESTIKLIRRKKLSKGSVWHWNSGIKFKISKLTPEVIKFQAYHALFNTWTHTQIYINKKISFLTRYTSKLEFYSIFQIFPKTQKQNFNSGLTHTHITKTGIHSIFSNFY